MIQEIKSRGHHPIPQGPSITEDSVTISVDPGDGLTLNKHTFRYRLWRLLHRFQGFEAKFALKTTMITSLLSVPAWLPQSQGWWNRYEVWWTVVMAWLMMHPR